MEAFKYFSSASGNMREGLPLEVIALDLNSGLEALGEIIGETTHDEIIEAEVEELEAGFGDTELYRDGRLLADHQAKFDAKQQELELLYRAYEIRIAR